MTENNGAGNGAHAMPIEGAALAATDPESPAVHDTDWHVAGPNSNLADIAAKFMYECGLDPTPDAVGQLVEVFLPCLHIMTTRGYDPDGGTWRSAGRLGTLTDVKKKFDRLWNRAWKHGVQHDDSAIDLINFTGMYLRNDADGWGPWGEPAPALVKTDPPAKKSARR
jgi:hypothetical protein